MKLLDKLNDPEKRALLPKEKPPLETDFIIGEEFDEWFVVWEVFQKDIRYPNVRALLDFGSDIFYFPQKTPPKEILQKVKSSLGKHLNLEDVTDLDVENGKLVRNKLPNPNLHITQFNKL